MNEEIVVHIFIGIEASLVAQMVKKNLPEMQDTQVLPQVGKIPERKEWLPTLVFVSGEFRGQRNQVGVCKESDTTE